MTIHGASDYQQAFADLLSASAQMEAYLVDEHVVWPLWCTLCGATVPTRDQELAHRPTCVYQRLLEANVAASHALAWQRRQAVTR